jgi:homoserine kinase type II
MTYYTKLSLKEVKEIAANYGFARLTNYKILSGGSENTNYLVEAETVKFVLTICEQKTPKEANDLARLLVHLEEHNFSTSKIIRTQENKAISFWNGKPVMVKNFLEGRTLEDLPDNLLKSIGKELGKLHQIPAPDYLPVSLNYGLECFAEIEKYAAGSPYHVWLQKKQDYIEKHISEKLPKALIHSDVFYSNVIVSKEDSSAIIMDFEEACNYYRIFDIGMAIIGLCKEGEGINLQKVKHLLEGYADEITLIPTELNSLKSFVVYAATAMSFWRHKNFNYVNPTPELYDHYKALKTVADYVDSLPSDCFSSLLKY